jgi:hypothetical protein
MKSTRKIAKAGAPTRFFTKTGCPPPPIHWVDVDLTPSLLNELDSVASELNVDRQSLIKTLLRQALDQHYLASSVRRKGSIV